MQQYLVQIENESHVQDFLNYMKSIGENHIEKLSNTSINFTEDEKNILDERRGTSTTNDYLPWDEARQKLVF